MTHTPGPWKWLHEEINAKHKKGTRRKANQMVFCLKGNTDRPHAMDHHDFTTVMELYWYSVKGSTIINASPKEADAHLIAAAPDLLAACKEAYFAWAHGVGSVTTSDDPDTRANADRNIREGKRIMGVIEAAIRKAEGGAG